MTDKRALQIYDEFFRPDHGGLGSLSPYYDDERALMVNAIRDILAAPTLIDAMRVIAYWGKPEGNMKLCRAMRAKYDAEGMAKR